MADIKEFNNLIGLTVTQAQKKIKKPFFIRTTEVKGQSLIITMEFNRERINVATDDFDVITRIKDFG